MPINLNRKDLPKKIATLSKRCLSSLLEKVTRSSIDLSIYLIADSYRTQNVRGQNVWYLPGKSCYRVNYLQVPRGAVG